MENKSNDKHAAHHHILPVGTAILIGLTLLVLTATTVWVAGIDLGHMNFVVAMLIATIKASLVCLFFMGLLYDHRENGMIFVTSFVFLTIFIVLTGTDLFTRGDIYVKGPLIAEGSVKSKFTKPWIETPELLARGKEVFAQNCVACHGAEGKGDGVAAAALVPKPRNFTSDQGWKNGRKVTMVFKTLKEGLPPSAMAPFLTMPADDRWAVAHYVLSLGPSKPQPDTPADFAKIGVDPNKETTTEVVEKSVSVDIAMAQIAKSAGPETANDSAHAAVAAHVSEENMSLGARAYHARCERCHGSQGEGGIRVRNLGVNPAAFVATRAFRGDMESLSSSDTFDKFVVRGLPGNLMPGYGELGSGELKELFQHVKQLSASSH